MTEAVRLTRALFWDLPVYDHTLPTGQTPGKRWLRSVDRRSSSRADPHGDDWMLGEFGQPYPEGHEHHGLIPIFWRPLVVDGQAARWPRGVAVSLRPVAGIRNAPEGHEEGELCGRTYPGVAFCLGKLEARPRNSDRGCSCFLSAPCGHCMSVVPECPACGHREPEPD